MKITKRDGTRENWNREKIVDAVMAAFLNCPDSKKDSDQSAAEEVAYEVASEVEKKFLLLPKSPSIEDVQKEVIHSLYNHGYFETMVCYIEYKAMRNTARTASYPTLDVEDMISSYIDDKDWRVNENSNMDKSFQGLVLHASGTNIAQYTLNKYTGEIRDAHTNGFMHIHDLSFGIAGYCAGWSLKDLLLQGIAAPGQCTSAPAKHFDTACGQIVNFLGTMQNEWAGAQAFNNVDTYLAPFIRRDNLPYKKVKQNVQKLIHNINTTSRWGGQCVPTDYECWTPQGWMRYNELNEGDLIFVFNSETCEISTDTLQRVVLNAESPELGQKNMVRLSMGGEVYEVTDYHRVVYTSDPFSQNITIREAKDIEESIIYIPRVAERKSPLTPEELSETRGVEWVRTIVGKSRYSGKVWCPTTETGTWITRKAGSKKTMVTGNCPFTNFTLDFTIPQHLKNDPVIIGGEMIDSTYGEYQHEVDMFNKAFLEVMYEGDASGQIFSFPIPTYNVTADFDWESENVELLMKMTARYGVPYFQNFINSDLNPEDVRSMCCRLQMDLREIRKKTGGLFGAGDLTGSIGVVTLNLPKYAYLAENEEEYFELVKKYCEVAKESLEIKRRIVQTNFDRGMFRWSKRYLKNGYRAHFSTLGIIGGHEACMNLLGKGIDSPEGVDLMQRTIDFIIERAQEFQEETGNLYNVEAVPGESTGYRLARIDKKLYGDNIYTQGISEPYYTNSTLLPVGYTDDVFEALEHQDQLQPKYSGGTVFHTFIGEAAPNTASVKEFLQKAMTLTKIPYISLTPTFSTCEDHGYINGEHWDCPDCGKPTQVYTRVVGYYRPVQRWNKGKREEYKDRVEYGFR